MENRRRAADPGGWAPRARLAGAVWLMLLAGCGGTGGGGASDGTAVARLKEGMEGLKGGVERGIPVAVAMTDGLRFEPARVTVPAGATVVWRNDSSMPHTVTADPARAGMAGNVQLPSGAEPFEAGSVPPGQAFARQFMAAGEYRYVCRIHEGSGMMGVVTVE